MFGSECYALAVTAVDSGSKALKFLGLHEEDDHSNPDRVPSVSPNDHPVKFLSLFLSTSVLIIFHLFWISDFFSSCFDAFAGSGSESYHYRLLYAWHDRL